ncbi:hypothetical protein [Actinoalloteichus fjordicus]|uniref:NTF2 domain-containing protein n=1 Tax=Actinoalloteichus fjordicus TaxID=1612552 RepID=A0AAC9LAJ4_9PSEU|nr:hypothetical protein [Actinoalloteichus fjordicus]APU13097.1 hypothetical protein UA74_05105 [Actinoalloteichus fjordicus]
MTASQTHYTAHATHLLQRIIPEFFRDLDADNSEKLKQAFDSDATLLVDGRPIQGAVAIANYLVQYRTEHAVLAVDAHPLDGEKHGVEMHDLIVLTTGYVRPVGTELSRPFAFTFRFNSGSNELIASGVYRITR